MLDLSAETEAMARRLGEERGSTIDATVRDALTILERIMPNPVAPTKDMSPEAIAARIAATERIVAEVKKLPILDPRPVQDIIDDLNDV